MKPRHQLRQHPTNAPENTRTLQSNRNEIVDALRGVAVTLMFFYHFCFDLNYFHWISVDFYHQPFWLHLRTFIVTLFLTLVGISLVLANTHGINWHATRARWSRLLACASLVSLGSYLVFPSSMIFFGVLHFILIASILGLFFLRFHYLNLLGAIFLITLGGIVQHPLFDQPMLQWIGLMTHKPTTEDYVPLLPWLGVVMLGIFLAQTNACSPKVTWQAQGIFRWFTFAGKHSLMLYMAHQPLFLGVLGLLSVGV